MPDPGTKLLLVEDDPNLGFMLKEFLELKGHEVEWVKNGEEGERAYFRGAFELLLLDVMMPKMDGFTLIQKIRQVDKSTPAIFLTAKSQTRDVLEGFAMGGDDYLTKPFSMEELLARIKALLRRANGTTKSHNPQAAPEYTLASLRFAPLERKLQVGKKQLNLTSKEAGLLELLLQNQGQLVERDAILKKLWKDDSYFSSRSMDVYITKLRKMLADDPAIQILNVHGEGYRLQWVAGS